MRVTMVQAAVGSNLPANKSHVLNALKNADREEWVVFPEGFLSGYAPANDKYVLELDWSAIQEAIAEIDDAVRAAGCHVIFGSAVYRSGCWTNTAISLHPDGPGPWHDKIELSALDRRHFAAGTGARIHRAGGVCFGMLACREVLFPALWSELKRQGAQIVFHVNNAIQPQDARWDALFVARALESASYVCTVNNCAPPQALASYLVTPSGDVAISTELLCPQVATAEIDLSAVIADLTTRSDY